MSFYRFCDLGDFRIKLFGEPINKSPFKYAKIIEPPLPKMLFNHLQVLNYLNKLYLHFPF